METSTQGKLFRQAALNRLASSEQLDQLVTVADAHSWVATLIIIGLFLFLMGWSFYGTIPIHIKSQGIILSLSGQIESSAGSDTGELRVLISISAGQRKKLHSGQVVRIESLAAQKEKYATLTGVLRQVSELPAASQDRVPLLSSEATVAHANEEQPYLAYLNLAKDAKAGTSYRWTSDGGLPFKFVSGTPINAAIIVIEQRPVGLLIPFLRKIADIGQ